MKRSRVVRLALLGSASALALAACDEAKDPLADNKSFFQDPAQCARVYDAETCNTAFANAQDEHRATAPRFASREECEEKFGVGNCQWGQTQPGQQASGGSGGFFMPLMMGYMMGNMMGSTMGSSSGIRSGSSSFRSSPVYRDTSNTVYSGSRTLGTTSISAAPSARGGFGSTSRSYSSSSSS
jgi:uncharacterized protein YgiB involved in biofilm formation